MGKNKRGGGIVEIDSKFIVKYTQNEDSSKKNSYIFESQNEYGNAIDLLTQDNILSYNVINYYFLLLFFSFHHIKLEFHGLLGMKRTCHFMGMRCATTKRTRAKNP